MNYRNACNKCRTGGLPKGIIGKATGTLGKNDKGDLIDSGKGTTSEKVI